LNNVQEGAMKKGFMGKILVVDLARGSISPVYRTTGVVTPDVLASARSWAPRLVSPPAVATVLVNGASVPLLPAL